MALPSLGDRRTAEAGPRCAKRAPRALWPRWQWHTSALQAAAQDRTFCGRRLLKEVMHSGGEADLGRRPGCMSTAAFAVPRLAGEESGQGRSRHASARPEDEGGGAASIFWRASARQFLSSWRLASAAGESRCPKQGGVGNRADCARRRVSPGRAGPRCCHIDGKRGDPPPCGAHSASSLGVFAEFVRRLFNACDPHPRVGEASRWSWCRDRARRGVSREKAARRAPRC